MDEVNMFELYQKNEDRQTHAFLALLKFLKDNYFAIFQDLVSKIGLCKSKKINAIDVKIYCQPRKIKDKKNKEIGVEWDGQITFGNNTFIAIESKVSTGVKKKQLMEYIDTLNNIKGYKNKKLVLLTHFDKNWLQSKYSFLKPNGIGFLKWIEIHKCITSVQIRKNNTVSFMIEEYLNFVQYNSRKYGGIIQTINQDILGNILPKIKSGKSNKFHMSELNAKLDVTNLKVFLYLDKKGVFASFVSDGIEYDKSRKDKYDGNFEYYFVVRDYNEFKKPVTKTKIMQNVDSSNLKKWDKHGKKRGRGQSSFILSSDSVQKMDYLIRNTNKKQRK